MPAKTPIGHYRHTPVDEIRVAPDGRRYHTHSRRRMPFAAQVFAAYALLGPLLATAAASALKLVDHGRLMPEVIGNTKLPPCPTLQNVLFGASWVDAVLGCGFAGWWFWSILWRSQFSVEDTEGGTRAILPVLVKRGMGWSLALTPLAGFLATLSLYIRTAPAEQPWIVRPFFGLIATLPMTVSALGTGIVPLVLLILGLLIGALTGAVVALVYPHYPEEAIHR